MSPGGGHPQHRPGRHLAHHHVDGQLSLVNNGDTNTSGQNVLDRLEKKEYEETSGFVNEVRKKLWESRLKIVMYEAFRIQDSSK